MLIDRLKLNIFYTLYAVLVDSWQCFFDFIWSLEAVFLLKLFIDNFMFASCSIWTLCMKI